MAILDNTKLIPTFRDQGIDCYKLENEDYLNRYYIVSNKDTRKLMFKPEVVGFEVYTSLLDATTRMMRHFKNKEMISSANILSILRGALNYPLEEACYRENIRVHDISFLSSERVFHEDEIAGLEIKYSKLAMVPDSTLLIGDIIATGDTLVHCLKYVIDKYKSHNAKLRNIIFFTIGGWKGIELMEKLTREIREFWPDFEGFITVYYEGVFSTYQDKGVSGINIVDVDFYWKGAILAPEYRYAALQDQNILFEKCVIYDGGARRYEIVDHVKEVLEFWEGLLERADRIDFRKLIEEKIGYPLPINRQDWAVVNHYEDIDEGMADKLYLQELDYLKSLENVTLKEIAEQRISEIRGALGRYML